MHATEIVSQRFALAITGLHNNVLPKTLLSMAAGHQFLHVCLQYVPVLHAYQQHRWSSLCDVAVPIHITSQ